jgi:hypothetical protein
LARQRRADRLRLPRGGSFDKVLAGEFLDKVSSLFFTIGVTLR